MAQGSAVALCGLVCGPAILVLLATAVERDFAAWRIERKRFGGVCEYVTMRWLRRGPNGRQGFASLRELREELDRFAELYNEKWLVQKHGYKTPNQVRAEQTKEALDEGAATLIGATA